MATHWRHTRDYRIWRAKVIRRDKRCVLCNSIYRREAHHINSGAYFPDLRFDPENGVCLCKNCHNAFHYLFMGSSRKKCTTKDFSRFEKLFWRIRTNYENSL